MAVVMSLALLALMVLGSLATTDVGPETRREVAVGLGKVGLAVFLLMASAALWAGYVLALRRHLPILVGLAYLLGAFVMADSTSSRQSCRN